jgi:hypothetical protein
MKRLIQFFIFVATLLFSACNRATSPTGGAIALTPMERPASEVPSATPDIQAALNTPPALPELPIVYYYFIAIESHTYPAGSVVILPDELVLGPTLSKSARSPDPITNISSALLAMLNDPRNAWASGEVGIASITFDEGNASVELQGEYSAVGDIVLIAARYQILLTIFAEETVQTATVTLNGENIANLGVSHTSQAKPADFAYTRAEIEAFMAENAYTPP